MHNDELHQINQIYFILHLLIAIYISLRYKNEQLRMQIQNSYSEEVSFAEIDNQEAWFQVLTLQYFRIVFLQLNILKLLMMLVAAITQHYNK